MNRAIPSGRAFVNRATMCLGLAASIAIAGCSLDDGDTLGYDPEARNAAFEQCMNWVKADPSPTRWERAVANCRTVALNAAQGMEARKGRDEGSVHDSPVAESDAPKNSLIEAGEL